MGCTRVIGSGIDVMLSVLLRKQVILHRWNFLRDNLTKHTRSSQYSGIGTPIRKYIKAKTMLYLIIILASQ